MNRFVAAMSLLVFSLSAFAGPGDASSGERKQLAAQNLPVSLSLKGLSPSDAAMQRVENTWGDDILAGEQIFVAPEVQNDPKFQGFVRVASKLPALKHQDLANPEFHPETLYKSINSLLQKSATLVGRQHAIVDAIEKGQLAVTGQEVGAAATVAIGGVICMGASLGCRQEGLKSRPYVRISLSTGGSADGPGGFAALAHVSQAVYTESGSPGANSGYFGPDLPSSLDGKMWGAGVGPFKQNGGGFVSKGFSVGVGVAELHSMYDMGLSIPLPVPGVNWIGVINENYLMWRLDSLERRIIQAIQSFELADADHLVRVYEQTQGALEARLVKRWRGSMNLNGAKVSETHPLADISRIFSSSALKKYERTPLLSAIASCGRLLKNVFLR